MENLILNCAYFLFIDQEKNEKSKEKEIIWPSSSFGQENMVGYSLNKVIDLLWLYAFKWVE